MSLDSAVSTLDAWYKRGGWHFSPASISTARRRKAASETAPAQLLNIPAVFILGFNLSPTLTMDCGQIQYAELSLLAVPEEALGRNADCLRFHRPPSIDLLRPDEDASYHVFNVHSDPRPGFFLVTPLPQLPTCRAS